eukprot:6205030-Pleurochrysis_carterae.AAC.2
MATACTEAVVLRLPFYSPPRHGKRKSNASPMWAVVVQAEAQRSLPSNFAYAPEKRKRRCENSGCVALLFVGGDAKPFGAAHKERLQLRRLRRLAVGSYLAAL